jgi:hypothetical protein
VVSTCMRGLLGQSVVNGASAPGASGITVVIRDHQRSSEVIRDHPRSSEVIRGHPRSSEVIRGHPRSSEVIRGHQRPSVHELCERRTGRCQADLGKGARRGQGRRRRGLILGTAHYGTALLVAVALLVVR